MICKNSGGPMFDAAPAESRETADILSLHRGVLTAYLHQLRAMEYLVWRLSRRIGAVDYRLSCLNQQEILLPPDDSEHDALEHFSGYAGYFLPALVLWFVVGILSIATDAEPTIFFALGALLLLGEAAAGALAVRGCGQPRAREESAERKRLQEERRMWYGQYREACERLRTLYEADVLPERFRGIYAVDTLCDALAGSPSDLEAAIRRLELEWAEPGLDERVVRQQEAVLRQLAQAARDDGTAVRHRAMIARAIAAEQDALLAARYRKIEAACLHSIAFSADVMSATALKNE